MLPERRKSWPITMRDTGTPGGALVLKFERCKMAPGNVCCRWGLIHNWRKPDMLIHSRLLWKLPAGRRAACMIS